MLQVGLQVGLICVNTQLKLFLKGYLAHIPNASGVFIWASHSYGPINRMSQAPEPHDLLSELVAKVYAAAPAADRGRLLEHLLKPLGLLSLAAVANGAFARLAANSGWSRLQINAGDVHRIGRSEVIALVSHVQQVSTQAIDSLGHVISGSPVLAGTAATGLLLSLLRTQATQRPPILDNDFDPIECTSV
jgi:hypothetical protein